MRLDDLQSILQAEPRALRLGPSLPPTAAATLPPPTDPPHRSSFGCHLGKHFALYHSRIALLFKPLLSILPYVSFLLLHLSLSHSLSHRFPLPRPHTPTSRPTLALSKPTLSFEPAHTLGPTTLAKLRSALCIHPHHTHARIHTRTLLLTLLLASHRSNALHKPRQPSASVCVGAAARARLVRSGHARAGARGARAAVRLAAAARGPAQARLVRRSRGERRLRGPARRRRLPAARRAKGRQPARYENFAFTQCNSTFMAYQPEANKAAEVFYGRLQARPPGRQALRGGRLPGQGGLEADCGQVQPFGRLGPAAAVLEPHQAACSRGGQVPVLCQLPRPARRPERRLPGGYTLSKANVGAKQARASRAQPGRRQAQRLLPQARLSPNPFFDSPKSCSRPVQTVQLYLSSLLPPPLLSVFPGSVLCARPGGLVERRPSLESCLCNERFLDVLCRRLGPSRRVPSLSPFRP
ncbi:hypothetical protein L1887_48918 [Cichorium endivia]|nr:hypothetical protein L1887_48918 [Cichorium endivia]